MWEDLDHGHREDWDNQDDFDPTVRHETKHRIQVKVRKIKNKNQERYERLHQYTIQDVAVSFSQSVKENDKVKKIFVKYNLFRERGKHILRFLLLGLGEYKRTRPPKIKYDWEFKWPFKRRPKYIELGDNNKKHLYMYYNLDKLDITPYAYLRRCFKLNLTAWSDGKKYHKYSREIIDQFQEDLLLELGQKWGLSDKVGEYFFSYYHL